MKTTKLAIHGHVRGRLWMHLGALLIRLGTRCVSRGRIDVEIDGKPWSTYRPQVDVKVNVGSPMLVEDAARAVARYEWEISGDLGGRSA